MFNPSSPLTGIAISGLTSPTYTFVADKAPDINASQWAVTALGGTQTGVTVHSPEAPFSFTIKRPKVVKTPGARNAATGQLIVVPKNELAFLLRKGTPVLPNGVQNDIITFDLRVRTPVGTAVNGDVQMAAAWSAFAGLISAYAQGLKDSSLTFVI